MSTLVLALGVGSSRASPHLTLSWLTAVGLGLGAIVSSFPAQAAEVNATESSRFALQAELRPLNVSADGRFEIAASVRYTPEAKSSDGRFALKVLHAPAGGCGAGVDGIFVNGFEN